MSSQTLFLTLAAGFALAGTTALYVYGTAPSNGQTASITATNTHGQQMPDAQLAAPAHDIPLTSVRVNKTTDHRANQSARASDKTSYAATDDAAIDNTAPALLSAVADATSAGSNEQVTDKNSPSSTDRSQPFHAGFRQIIGEALAAGEIQFTDLAPEDQALVLDLLRNNPDNDQTTPEGISTAGGEPRLTENDTDNAGNPVQTETETSNDGLTDNRQTNTSPCPAPGAIPPQFNNDYNRGILRAMGCDV